MGGRYDSTIVIPPDSVQASVITSIGMDHAEVLGNTVDLIGEEKA